MKATKKIFGICKVGEKGQIVIPKDARDMFNISAGDSLIIMGDSTRGIAIVKAEVFENLAEFTMGDSNEN